MEELKIDNKTISLIVMDQVINKKKVIVINQSNEKKLVKLAKGGTLIKLIAIEKNSEKFFLFDDTLESYSVEEVLDNES